MLDATTADIATMLRGSLLELGYPDAEVVEQPWRATPIERVRVAVGGGSDPTPRALWQAWDVVAALLGIPYACWECWSADQACTHILGA